MGVGGVGERGVEKKERGKGAGIRDMEGVKVGERGDRDGGTVE